MRVSEILYYAGFLAVKSMGIRKRKRLPAPVISIGNLTTGGTGKTPLTIEVSREALRRGLGPCILTRGYGGKAEGPCFVSRGEGPVLDEGDAGDEPVLMALKVPGVPIVKGKDRHEAGLFALGNLPGPPGVFILDDGYQHWRLHRDTDVLLIDAGNPFDNGHLLPLGHLRETPKAALRADVILLTKCEGRKDLEGLKAEIRRLNPRAPLFTSSSRVVYVREAASGAKHPPVWLSGKDVYAFCGIGQPGSFLNTLRLSGAEVAGMRAFKDHHRYGRADFEYVKGQAGESRALWIVTTEKDIMRMGDIEMPENLLAIGIDYTVEEGFYEKVFDF